MHVKSICWYKGINSEGGNRIIEHGNHIMAYKYHIEDDQDDSALSNLMKQNHIDNPGKYKPWTGGVFWHSNLSLDIFLDVVMHLLFLGVVKAARDLISI